MDSYASARMKRIRQAGTAPELAVRQIVHELGARYRVNRRNLPGRPDLSNEAKGWAIMVHGCFWHGHENCRLATLPKTRREWWSEKLSANRARDAKKETLLGERGFRVLTVWQCELADHAKLRKRLRRFLRA